MATRNIPAPSNPYASGAVVFDSTPYTEFYIKEQQKEKAKDEALEKYLMDFDKSINPAGMRNNDVPAFLEKIGQNKNFYLKNKAAIKNPALDNGAAYSQWYNANKSALAEISKSKFLAEKDARISKATLDAAKSGKKITDDFQRRLERFRSTPMNSPDFIDINEEEVSFNHKPFDHNSFTKNVFFGLPFSKRVVSSKKDEANKRIVDLVEEYLPENSLPVIKNRAVYEYEKDGGFAEVVDAAIFDEKKIDDLNKLFKPLFKKPIEDKQDLATAIALSLSPIGKTVEVSRDDKVAMFNMSEAGRNTRNERSAANRGSGADFVTSGNIIDEIDSGETELGSGKKVIILQGEVFNSDKTPYNGQIFITRNKLPASLYSALKVMGTDDLFLKGNKGFTAKIVDGQIESLSDERIGNVDRRFLENAQLKLNTEPQKGRQMQFGGRNQRPQGQQNSGRKYKGLDKNGNPIFE